MLNDLTKRLVLGGLLAVLTTFAAVDTADAQTRRLRFDPAYGAPFDTAGNELGWKGYADVSYGSCDGPGLVTNLPGSCNGTLSFLSATVELYNTADAGDVLQTIHFGGGAVMSMNFNASNELTQVFSAPFTPALGMIDETRYNGSDQAWFSLVFVGEYAQLIWFDQNPGTQLSDLPTYWACYLYSDGGSCGISSSLNGAGARLTITAVPEPQTYALMLGGLAALGLIARRRRAAVR